MNEREKTQLIRLLDIFLLAPFLIWLSLNKDLPSWIRIILFSTGVLTFLFNGRNYLRVKQFKEEHNINA